MRVAMQMKTVLWGRFFSSERPESLAMTDDSQKLSGVLSW